MEHDSDSECRVDRTTQHNISQPALKTFSRSSVTFCALNLVSP